ncbi:NACHT and Ankyrin domain protein [Penicillium argentinense]|uniref:NACHT and Ankyrin domain protein n=1 Tax=Penicillium argentinense TaxID=1131581 RepID=A0A9W9EW06_9EURO|nr:NACHT and Ankyrin domain protein [Penicillium argentinense]KAJ5089017.1 NACHT and Ankyrin domain protein [Penicillium argentinense]
MVRLLVSDVRVDANWKDFRQITPLSVAAACGMERAIRSLVAHGADINSWDENGDTPLHYAARKRQETSLRQLFQYHHLDVTATNKNGARGYHIAILTLDYHTLARPQATIPGRHEIPLSIARSAAGPGAIEDIFLQKGL